ncbi:hypothetical protein AOLI_G00202920 [Acnodon oligacanthus]
MSVRCVQIQLRAPGFGEWLMQDPFVQLDNVICLVSEASHDPFTVYAHKTTKCYTSVCVVLQVTEAPPSQEKGKGARIRSEEGAIHDKHCQMRRPSLNHNFYRSTYYKHLYPVIN